MTSIRVLEEYMTEDQLNAALIGSHDDVVVSGLITVQGGIRKVFGIINFRDPNGTGHWKRIGYWKSQTCGINTPNSGIFSPCHIKTGNISIGVLCCLDGQQTILINSLYSAMNSKIRIIAVPSNLSSHFSANDPEYKDSSILFCNGNDSGARSFARLSTSGEVVITSESVLLKLRSG